MVWIAVALALSGFHSVFALLAAVVGVSKLAARLGTCPYGGQRPCGSCKAAVSEQTPVARARYVRADREDAWP